MRDVIGGRVLQDVVEKREEIAESIEQIIAKTAFDWGVNIESILIKDLTLPDKVQASLSMAAEAKRIGEGKIINAKAEVESAKLMRKAADILASKPAMQIRYLDALQNMAKSPGTRVIFMPSAQEVEKMAGSNIGDVYVDKGKGKLQDLEEDTDWAGSDHERVASPTKHPGGNKQQQACCRYCCFTRSYASITERDLQDVWRISQPKQVFIR